MKSNMTASKVRLAQSLAAASGAFAATIVSSQAATVQITLSGNKIDSSANALNADVTGDGNADLTFQSATGATHYAGVSINGLGKPAALVNDFTSGTSSGFPIIKITFAANAKFANDGVGLAFVGGSTLSNARCLNPIRFTDARINGGASTQGYLEVNAFNTSSTFQTVALTRLVFDDASTTLGTAGLSTGTTYATWVAVPEPSSFGLLALGAGGLLARRRRQAA